MPRAQAIALIVVALVLGFVVGFKSGKGSMAAQTGATCPTVPPTASVTAPTPPAAAPEASPTAAAALPRLVDLGSTTCIPCKEMAPILDELKTELKGKVEVEFINVTENMAAADEYKISVIPTQVFLDKDGKEVFRHEGFFPKADILAQLEKMGVKTK
jgi:thioredoxin 1